MAMMAERRGNMPGDNAIIYGDASFAAFIPAVAMPRQS
jgi:hypothetical protein